VPFAVLTTDWTSPIGLLVTRAVIVPSGAIR